MEKLKLKPKFKSLSELGLNITEEEYFNDGTIHHSTISSYEKKGFHSIPTLNNKKESDSLLFGSMVDTMVTDSLEAFNNSYHVAQFPDISDVIAGIVKGLYGVYKDSCSSIDEIPDDAIIATADAVSYGTSWYARTRLEKIKTPGREYYRQLYLAGDKKVVPQQMYDDAMACYNALKTSPATKRIFADNDPSSIEHTYQLKFRSFVKYDKENLTYKIVDAGQLTAAEISQLVSEGYLAYSIMADEIMVFHDKKIVLPIDLKTSSHFEDEFYQSFIDWGYSHQARMYWRNIRAAMDADDYFKDFKLLDYLFVVVNKRSRIPLVWNYTDTQKIGTLIYGKNQQIVNRDPYDLGIELTDYQNRGAIVPNGIYTNKPNDIVTYLNTL